MYASRGTAHVARRSLTVECLPAAANAAAADGRTSKTKSIANAEDRIEDLTNKNEMNEHASLLQGVLSRSVRKVVVFFVQAPQDYFDAAATVKQSYAPQSGEMTDKEWEERQKTRQLEMEAVSTALAVLAGTDAHDLSTKTFNPALLRRESTEHSQRRAAASRALSAVAGKVHSPRLATLAYQVKLDAFTRVKKAIDDMISQLLKGKEAEVKHKDFCVDEFNADQWHVAHRTLRVARRMPHVIRCTSHGAYCTWRVARCALHGARCTLHVT